MSQALYHGAEGPLIGYTMHVDNNDNFLSLSFNQISLDKNLLIGNKLVFIYVQSLLIVVLSRTSQLITTTHTISVVLLSGQYILVICMSLHLD